MLGELRSGQGFRPVDEGAWRPDIPGLESAGPEQTVNSASRCSALRQGGIPTKSVMPSLMGRSNSKVLVCATLSDLGQQTQALQPLTLSWAAK